MAAGGYPGKYRTGDEITGLPTQPLPNAKVFHAGTGPRRQRAHRDPRRPRALRRRPGRHRRAPRSARPIGWSNGSAGTACNTGATSATGPSRGNGNRCEPATPSELPRGAPLLPQDVLDPPPAARIRPRPTPGTERGDGRPCPRTHVLRPERPGAALRGPALVDRAALVLEEHAVGAAVLQMEQAVCLGAVLPRELAGRHCRAYAPDAGGPPA